MKPTLRQLRYIIAVAETGRFHEAAKKVNVSQPTLSVQIADVEAQLGVQLIERGRSGAIMTPIGEEFVRRARTVLRDMEDLKSAMQTGGETLSGRIRIGVLPSVGPYLLPSAIKELHKSYPELRLIVQEHLTADLQDHLESGALDCAISTLEDHREMASLSLFEEGLWICAAPDDPLAGKGPVKPGELEGRALLTVGASHRLAQTVQNIADFSKAEVSSVFTGTSLDAIRQMAATGAGVAVLPAIYALSEARRDPDLVLRPLQHPLARRRVAMIWRPRSPISDAFVKIANILSRYAQEILVEDEHEQACLSKP